MEITDLITRAQQLGVTIYPQNGRIQVDMPWPVSALPDQVRSILGELKKQQGELLAHFALSGVEPDINLILAALQVQGVRVAPDSEAKTGFRIYITTEVPDRCNELGIKLIKRLHDCKDVAAAYLQGQLPEPG